jgi:baculoviral IAP repeat-containing protein 6
MIIGPKDTPYEDGCYFFDMILPETYPKVCPKVHFLTTGHGKVRFNPNLYNCGKVCLSLLGTWQGESWTENSTILQLLVSIQSLILIEEPYYNEPGHTSYYNTPSGKSLSENYNKKIQLENLNWGIINCINTINSTYPEFEEIVNTHFKFKKNDILKRTKQIEVENHFISKSLINELEKTLNKY